MLLKLDVFSILYIQLNKLEGGGTSKSWIKNKLVSTQQHFADPFSGLLFDSNHFSHVMPLLLTLCRVQSPETIFRIMDQIVMFFILSEAWMLPNVVFDLTSSFRC